jgi:hypothetical protein
MAQAPDTRDIPDILPLGIPDTRLAGTPDIPDRVQPSRRS